MNSSKLWQGKRPEEFEVFPTGREKLALWAALGEVTPMLHQHNLYVPPAPDSSTAVQWTEAPLCDMDVANPAPVVRETMFLVPQVSNTNI
jgi:hypothetical protein